MHTIIGDYIVALRVEQGISMNTLAAKTGIRDLRLVQIENEGQIPTAEELARITAELGADFGLMCMKSTLSQLNVVAGFDEVLFTRLKRCADLHESVQRSWEDIVELQQNSDGLYERNAMLSRVFVPE